MKRYNIWLEKWREGDETYYELETQVDKSGEWVKAEVNEPEAARGFEQQAEYQVSLLKTIFGVDYENLVSRGDLT